MQEQGATFIYDDIPQLLLPLYFFAFSPRFATFFARRSFSEGEGV
jgi:hypothetical protein